MAKLILVGAGLVFVLFLVLELFRPIDGPEDYDDDESEVPLR